MIRPKLFEGARVALLCPSGTVSAQKLDKAVDAVKTLGLSPVVYDSATSAHGYLAGDDALRAGDINAAFRDYTIDGILCLRGGYGANRLLPLLDFATIARRPKYFAGYSDITALLNAFTQECGFMTYHAIMPSSDYCEGCDEYSLEFLKRTMFGSFDGEVRNPDGKPFLRIASGRAKGTLCGGNLSVLVYSLGTPWEVDTRGRILFLEDVHEDLYRLDGMLTQLRNAGKFRDCAGVLLGSFTDCEAKKESGTLPLEQIIEEIVVPCGKPIMGSLAFGHELPSMSLPVGAEASFDADELRFEIHDAARS